MQVAWRKLSVTGPTFIYNLHHLNIILDSEGEEDVIDERSLDNKVNNLVNHSEETLSDDEENKIR